MIKHLFKKKINTNCCFENKHDGECRYLERVFLNAGLSQALFCRKFDKYLKHSDHPKHGCHLTPDTRKPKSRTARKSKS